MPSPVKALVFDMDGTLVDNMRYHERAWIAFFEKRGLSIDAELFFKQTAGRHNREIMRDWIDPNLSEEQILALAEEKEGLYRALYAPHRHVLGGFEAFALAAKARGLRLAVATSAPPANIDFILDALDLRQHFNVVVGASHVKRGKPHPDIYLRAAEELRIAPAACIAFEDAPAGVESANAAGMTCVALTTYLQAERFDTYPGVIAKVPDYTHLNLETLLLKAA
jgi:beta-phosphoglucomutase family hydrolase